MNNIKLMILLFVIFTIFGVIIFNQPKVNIEKPVQQISTQEKKIEVLIEGIKKPHGIGDINGQIHVSSETDKTLYKIENGRAEKLATLDFGHDMWAWSRNASIIAVFNENRLVEIDEKGNVRDILKGLRGPNGITYDQEGLTYYLSNYNSGTVISFKKEDPKPELVVGNLKGPAGLAFDGLTRRLFISNYLDGSITIVKDKTVLQNIRYPNLNNIESLSLDARNNLRATAIQNGKGVVVILNEDGTYKVLLETELPEPLVGYFTEFEVYLVSPNDLRGRVLKAKLY